ncbi:transcription antitermination factor NusB [Deinococcus radiopugnans]|uniref:transcription antitermination factor NusB n=1 Tax=Deinococcus radiopugnans TaxID=57497 RepID=UPI0036191B57
MTFTPRPRPEAFNPARELAVRVLLRVLAGESFAAPALDAALQKAHLPGRDAGLATHIVYGTLRHFPSLDTALSPMLTGDTHPKVRTLLLAGAFEKLYLDTPPHAVVSEYVNLARGARLAPPGLVNAVLRRIEAPAPSQVTRTELPGWLAETYRAAYGAQAEAVFADLLTPQPLWLSVSEAGFRSLEAEGSRLNPGPQGTDRVELSRPCARPRRLRAAGRSRSTLRVWPAWTRWARCRVSACWTWPAARASRPPCWPRGGHR